MTDDTACAAAYAPLVRERSKQMTGTSSTPTGVTPAGYVPNFVRNAGSHAELEPASSMTADVPPIAPELVTRVLTLEAANEARRVIADARRRLAEIAARASQTSPVHHPGETPGVREPPSKLEAVAARRTPPTLRAQRPAGALTLQDPPRAASGPAGSTGLSREYEWEQAVKAPFERLPAAPPGPARTPAGTPDAARPAGTPRTGLSREYEWELAVKAPFQVAPQKGPIGVLESLKSAAFPSPNPMPDQRRSERR
jgi:hypothetical protein